MAICLDIDARLHAIARDIGEDEVLESLARQAPNHFIGRSAHAFAPPIHLHLAGLGGHIGHEQLPKLGRRCLGKQLVAHEHGAHGDALGAQTRQLVDSFERTHAAAHVD